MRTNLKNARKEHKITQGNVAEHLGVTLRYYQKIESGEMLGSISLWDSLEDLFCINQRLLREISENHHAQEDNQ